MAQKVTKISKNVLSEWQKELNQFNKKKLEKPVFINTFLTPEDADFLLEDNEHNRHRLVRYVNRYADFMEDGKWRLNGECIKISSEGLLLDGQHRLAAIRIYGKPVEMSVAIGVNPDTFSINDTGKSRTPNDILKIAGYKNCSTTAAALRLLLQYQDNEDFDVREDYSPDDILEAIKRYPHIQYFINPAWRIGRFASHSLLTFFMYITMTINEEDAHDFFYKLRTGEKLGKTSSIRMLRELLIKLQMQKMHLDRRHLVASFIIAWNAFIEDQRIKSVRWNGKDFPLITGIDRKKIMTRNSGLSAKKTED